MGALFRNMHGISKVLRSITSSFKEYDYVTICDELYQDWLKLPSFVSEETTDLHGQIGYVANFKDSKNSKWSIKTYACDPGPFRYGTGQLRFVGYVKHNGQIVGSPKMRYEKYIKKKDKCKATDYVIVSMKEE